MAEPEPWSIIGGDSTCPRPDAVWAEVTTLVPRERLGERIHETQTATPTIQIIDLGAPYRVIAAGRVREYRDDARDCAHRAHVAAVFVALVLDPAAFAPPPVAIIPAAATPGPPPARSHIVQVELGAAIGTGTSTDSPMFLGPGLRIVIGRDALALVGGATALAPRETAVNGLRVRELRVPADLGVRARLRTSGTEISGDVGLTVAFLSETALDLVKSNHRSTTEVGARLGLGWRLFAAARLTPFVGAYAELVPRPTALFVLPQGVVGHTPSVWIGAVAGASLGL